MHRRNFIKTTALGTAGLTISRLYAMEPRIDRFTGGKYCVQPGTEIPVIAEVDVLIAGATLGGISAAISASGSGMSAFVTGYLPYFGEDICGTYKYLFNKTDFKDFGHYDVTYDPLNRSGESLARKLFEGERAVSPMHIKTVLEKELIEHGVDFLYCSYISDVIFGDDNQPAGVIITNRSGRQAILCKSLIDCTQGASVARLAGCSFRKLHSGGNYEFQFVTVGNKTLSSRNVSVTRLPSGAVINQKKYDVLENRILLPVEDFSFVSLARAEQEIRDRTWDIDQVDSSDNIFCTSPSRLDSKMRFTDENANIEDIPPEAFLPLNADNLFVCGPCADVPENISKTFASPPNQIKLGSIIGRAASDKAGTGRKPGNYFTRPVRGVEYIDGVTGEISETLRPNLGNKKIFSEKTALPVLGEYDVVVAGGGTAGAPAAIAAARNGAKTLVVEYLHGLGGTGTLGMIGRYWYGHRDGFTKEIDMGVREMADASHPRHKPRDHEWVKDWKMEWYRREIRKAGGEIWFGVLVAGAFVEDGKVKGILIATPEGRGVILAKQVIDATGSADIAIAAGAKYEYTGKGTVAVQGSGLPKVDPDDHYNNTDWTFVDDSDVFDVTRVFVSGKRIFQSAYDLGKLPQTRERRRIIADFMVSPIDMLNGRRYHDTISYHVSNFDTHGYTIHPYFIIKQPDGGHVTYDVDLPLRSLLPVGLDCIIVTGLGAGAHRDAMPVIRMQPCLQNQGYAVGCLAAKLVKENISAREVDLRGIQKHLAEIGNFPGRVITDKDNMPLPDSAFQEAVSKIGNDFDKLEVLFSDIDRGKRYLEGALKRSAGTRERVNIAIALGVLENDSGWKLLVDEVDQYEGWDEGWNFTGMGQFGFSLSRLDTTIIALGRCKRDEGLRPVMDKAKILTADHHFSHFRAVSVAFETMGSRKAAPVLFEILGMPGISGHHVITMTDAFRSTVDSDVDVSVRNNVLRELHLARALYRCGDHYGLGKRILENYSNDLHGHYYRHAAGILDIGPEFS